MTEDLHDNGEHRNSNGVSKKTVTKNVLETYTLASKFTEEIIDTVKKNKRNRALVVALFGEVGSGKTSFVQGAAIALGIRETVNSPTFVIERIYSILEQNNPKEIKTKEHRKQSLSHNEPFTHFIHIDCYRLENSKELQGLGWEKIIAGPFNIIFIEWAEKAEDLLPEDTVKISFEYEGKSKRKIKILNYELGIKN